VSIEGKIFGVPLYIDLRDSIKFLTFLLLDPEVNSFSIDSELGYTVEDRVVPQQVSFHPSLRVSSGAHIAPALSLTDSSLRIG
jgi:hypothetical protein